MQAKTCSLLMPIILAFASVATSARSWRELAQALMSSKTAKPTGATAAAWRRFMPVS